VQGHLTSMLWHSLVVLFLLNLYQLLDPTPPTVFIASSFLPKSLGKFTRAHFSHCRNFMQHYKMWGPTNDTGPGLWVFLVR